MSGGLASGVHYGALVVLLLFLIAPLIAFLFNAFAFRWFYPQFIPNEISFRAWATVADPNSKVLEAFVTSVGIALGVTLASIAIGLPAARALGLYAFRGKRVIEFLLLAPTIVPGVAIALGLNINFLRWGLAGEPFGVGLVHLVPVMPYVVLVLSGVFANYDTNFEDQARSLGARPLAIFWYVTLPAIIPGVMVAGLFAFLISWSQYILTFLIGSGRVVTLPILLFSTAAGGNAALTAAMSLVFIGPAILVLILISRYLSGESGAVGGFGKI
ncbi:MAG: ABC transporter permease [Trueperaceae bacterium]|nr:ABC transporter permease [Trueperaceae bacterium]